jgi:uncharacterized membrane protein YdbT with pleckstrin-like domain
MNDRYVKSILYQNEKVLKTAKIHWVVFLPYLFLIFLYLIVTCFPWGMVQKFFSFSTLSFLIFLPVFIIFIKIFSILIYYITSEFVITTERIVIKTGFIKRNSFEIPINRIESIHFDQSVLGRILNYGTILITGKGSSTYGFKNIANPIIFKKQILQQKNCGKKI